MIMGGTGSLPEGKRDIILLSFPTIVLASHEDEGAINDVLKYNEGYIAALSMRTLFDESGNPHLRR